MDDELAGELLDSESLYEKFDPSVLKSNQGEYEEGTSIKNEDEGSIDKYEASEDEELYDENETSDDENEYDQYEESDED